MVAGREQLPLRQTEGFGPGLVLPGLKQLCGFVPLAGQPPALPWVTFQLIAQLWSPPGVSHPATLRRRGIPLNQLLPYRAPGSPLCCQRLPVGPQRTQEVRSSPQTTQMGRAPRAGGSSGSH